MLHARIMVALMTGLVAAFTVAATVSAQALWTDQEPSEGTDPPAERGAGQLPLDRRGPLGVEQEKLE
jgi:hypothetical protein